MHRQIFNKAFGSGKIGAPLSGGATKENDSSSLSLWRCGTKSRGYIALISAIIISVLLMTITFTLSSVGFLGRRDILVSEFKERSLALAEACADSALLKLAQSGGYGGNETITVGSDQCQILPIESIGSDKIIKTKSAFQAATTNLKVVARSQDWSIISWEELPNF